MERETKGAQGLQKFLDILTDLNGNLDELIKKNKNDV
jgi:hypothetical protein